MNRPTAFELLVLRALKALILLDFQRQGLTQVNHYANALVGELNEAVVRGYKS